jgi:hypothetical protein
MYYSLCFLFICDTLGAEGGLYWSLSYKSFMPVSISQGYNDVSNSLESLAELALAKWLARI